MAIQGGRTTIPSRIERLPITRFTWQIVMLAGLAWFVESLSIGCLGVVLPLLKKTMTLTPGAVGLLVASATFGIVIGLIPAGNLSDKYGRKKVLVWGIIWYSIFTILSAFSQGFTLLLICRFLSGLGMGAVFPLPYAIVGEFVNSRSRAIFNGVMDACLSLGYFIAPLLGLVILPRLSPDVAWRVFFLVSGLPVIYAYLIHAYLPESPRWLLRKGREEDAEAVLSEIEARVRRFYRRELPLPEPDMVTLHASGEKPKGSIWLPWTKNYVRRTIVSSIAAIGTFFMFYIVMTYMPTIFQKEGLSYANSLIFTAIITGAAIPGKLLNGFLSEHIGRKVVYVGFMGIAGIGAMFFGITTTAVAMVTYACVMSFFGTGAFPALKMSYAEQYPTEIRTTGAATVETVGRFFGGVVGSYAMPAIINSLGLTTGFHIVAIITFAAVLVVLLGSQETKGATLEQLEQQLRA